MMMSRRGMILAILIACAVLGLAIWGGSLIGAARSGQIIEETQAQLKSSRDEFSQLQTSYTNLQKDTVSLRTQLMATEASISQMQSGYVNLQQEAMTLRTQKMTSDDTISHMQSANTVLQQDTAKLQAEFTMLNVDYNALKIRYDTLEKTKTHMVDNRLKVQLTTEQQFGGVTWVRGEVTNIGSTTVSKIYVIVSRYKSDGSLDNVDLPPAIITNLSPGNSGQFSYVASGGNSKVTILGDY